MKLEKIQVRLYGGNAPGDPDRMLKAAEIAVRRDGDSWYRVGKPEEFIWRNMSGQDVEVRSVRIAVPRVLRAITDEIFLKNHTPSVVKGRVLNEKTKKYDYSTVTVSIPERILEIKR